MSPELSIERKKSNLNDECQVYTCYLALIHIFRYIYVVREVHSILLIIH